jgi:putative transcriptional regulator
MTRAQLAAHINVNPQTVGALERGDHYPSLDLAFRICDVFGLPVEAVFSRAAFTPLSAELYGTQDANGRKSTDVTPDHRA